MKYIQETASSSSDLSIQRNKRGLNHEQRPYIEPLKILGLDSEYVW